MESNLYVRNFYLDYLCTQNLWKDALYFAIIIGLNELEYPPALINFCVKNPFEEEKILAEIARYYCNCSLVIFF